LLFQLWMLPAKQALVLLLLLLPPLLLHAGQPPLEVRPAAEAMAGLGRQEGAAPWLPLLPPLPLPLLPGQ
jgi:hypothetical protein